MTVRNLVAALAIGVIAIGGSTSHAAASLCAGLCGVSGNGTLSSPWVVPESGQGSYNFTDYGGSLPTGWYDPTYVDKYTYSLSTGDFQSVTLPAGISATVSGATGTWSGSTFTFAPLVSSFALSFAPLPVPSGGAGTALPVDFTFTGSANTLSITATVSAVPLPASLLLFATATAGLAGLSLWQARRAKAIKVKPF